MEMRETRYFMELAECKSVQRAAQHLYISPQGLRKGIRRLESELGCNLFDPQSPNWDLTKEGKIFLTYARKLKRDTDDMYKQIRLSREEARRIVRIMVAPHTRELIRGTVFSKFETQYPDIKLILEEAVDSVCERKLNDPSYSFGILQSPYNTEKFDVEEIFSSNFFIWMRENDPLACRNKLLLRDLDGQKLCLLDSAHKAYDNFMIACAQANVAPIIRETTDSIWIAKEVLDHGGYGLTLAHYPDAFGLVKRPIADFSWGLAICRPKARMLSDDAFALINLLRKDA